MARERYTRFQPRSPRKLFYLYAVLFYPVCPSVLSDVTVVIFKQNNSYSSTCYCLERVLSVCLRSLFLRMVLVCYSYQFLPRWPKDLFYYLQLVSGATYILRDAVRRVRKECPAVCRDLTTRLHFRLTTLEELS